MSRQPEGIVAFDLDGTLLRGPTVCELLARPLGRLSEMRRFETFSSEQDIAAARAEMAQWYHGLTPSQLCTSLEAATWAPGAREGVELLQANRIEVVLASITWCFAVEWVAERLGISRVLGTELEPTGHVRHTWPRDKGAWLLEVSADIAVPTTRVAAVGDSISDLDLLSAASLRFFVGVGAPPFLVAMQHRPAGNIASIAREILTFWATS